MQQGLRGTYHTRLTVLKLVRHPIDAVECSPADSGKLIADETEKWGTVHVGCRGECRSLSGHGNVLINSD